MEYGWVFREFIFFDGETFFKFFFSELNLKNRDGVSVSRETCSTTISRDVAVNVRIGPANDMPKILRYVLVSTCCISTSDSFPKPINQPSSSGTVANGIWLGFSRIHIFRWRDIFQNLKNRDSVSVSLEFSSRRFWNSDPQRQCLRVS